MGIFVGHHRRYSTEFLNFFFLGVSTLSNSIFFKMKEILFSVFSFKNSVTHVVRMLTNKKLDLVLVFEELDQFSAVTHMIQSGGNLNRMNNKLGYSFFSILKPQSGFLTSTKRLIAPDFIVGSLPDDVYYSKSIFMSFGYGALITTLKELNGRVGSINCGVVDSNQRHT